MPTKKLNSRFITYNKLKDAKLTNTNDILGVKYIIACGGDSPDAVGYEEYDQIGSYRIYKNNKIWLGSYRFNRPEC